MRGRCALWRERRQRERRDSQRARGDRGRAGRGRNCRSSRRRRGRRAMRSIAPCGISKPSWPVCAPMCWRGSIAWRWRSRPHAVAGKRPRRWRRRRRRPLARPVLKVKLGGAGDPARIAGRAGGGARGALASVDANQAGRLEDCPTFAACQAAGVASSNSHRRRAPMRRWRRRGRPVPGCADESVHDRAGLDPLHATATIASTSSSRRQAG